MHERGIAIIPARLGSTRLPGKVLLNATGKPLIQHVWESVRKAGRLERVVIATDAKSVLEECRRFGAEAIMTREDHPNGTSRLHEAAKALVLNERAIIVNVQGDEPEIEPGVIDGAIEALVRGEQTTRGAQVGTMAAEFGEGENPADPNCVKVVRDVEGCALYFSRSLVPMDRDGGSGGAGIGTGSGTDSGKAKPLRHVGIYAYRAEFLARYAKMEATPLERTEMLEQLRVLEHGGRICVGVCAQARIGIDTTEQYANFVERYKQRAGKG